MDLDTDRPSLGAGAVVLLHTLPPGRHGVRSEEAAFRQYNSCVDFTFQERRGNARKLKRLNAVFERAADRKSGGIREDKLLRILPSGTASKYGIDAKAVKRRLHARREWQEEQKRLLSTAAAAAAKSKRRRKKRRDKGNSSGQQQDNADIIANSGLGPCPELRVLSRGTFLAMFANETTTFVNTMGQNERADRERKMRRGGAGSDRTGGSYNSGSNISNADPALSSATSSSEAGSLNQPQQQPQPQQYHRKQQQQQQEILLAESEQHLQHFPPSSASPHSFPVLEEMTNNPSSSLSTNSGQHQHQQLSDATMNAPLAESDGSRDAYSSDRREQREEEKVRPSNRSRTSGNRQSVRQSSSSSHSRRVQGNGEYVRHEHRSSSQSSSLRSGRKSSRSASGRVDNDDSRASRSSGRSGRKEVHDSDDMSTGCEDGSVSSLSTMGSNNGGLDKQRMNHRRHDSSSSLSSSAEPYNAPGLHRSLSHDQHYFTNDLCGRDTTLSPETCNNSFAGSDGTSPGSTSSFPFGGMPLGLQQSHQLPHHSADAAAGGWSSSKPVVKDARVPDPKLEVLVRPSSFDAERRKSGSSTRSGRRTKTSRSDKMEFGLDDNESFNSGSFQNGGKRVGQSPSKEERRALRRERRRRKEEERRADVQLELKKIEARQHELRLNQPREHQIPMVCAGVTGPGQQRQQQQQQQQRQQQQQQSSTHPRVFGSIPQRDVYSCESISEDEQECVFLATVANALRNLIPHLCGKKKPMIGVTPIGRPQKGANLNHSSLVPGINVSGFRYQNNMIGTDVFGQDLSPHAVGHHRRAASLNTPVISAANTLFTRHQRTNSMDGQLPPTTSSIQGRMYPKHQLVGFVPLGAGPVTPGISGLSGFALLSGNPNLAPTSTSATSSCSASPMDLRSSLPNGLQAFGQSDGDYRHYASNASFSSVSSHSTGTNGSASLAGEFVFTY